MQLHPLAADVHVRFCVNTPHAPQLFGVQTATPHDDHCETQVVVENIGIATAVVVIDK